MKKNIKDIEINSTGFDAFCEIERIDTALVYTWYIMGGIIISLIAFVTIFAVVFNEQRKQIDILYTNQEYLDRKLNALPKDNYLEVQVVPKNIGREI